MAKEIKKSDKQKKIYLIDASCLFFRAYYAIPFMQTKVSKKPIPTNAVFGYLKTLLKIIDQHQPAYMVCCFDRPEPSYRVKVYKEYKANRDEMPKDLQQQMPYIKSVTDALGIPRMDMKTYEADDVIGSLSLWAKQKGAEVCIISTDKDFAQLVEDGVYMQDPVKDIKYDKQGVKAKWNVYPEQMIDYLSIIGDASDNVPGVKGIGPKGAEKLFDEFHNLENIYANLDKLPEKVAQKLQNSKKEAFLSQELIRIVRELKLAEKWEDVQKKEIQKESFEKLLIDLEFHSIHKTYQAKNKLAATHITGDLADSSNQGFTLSSKNQKMKKNKISLQKLDETLAPFEVIGVHLYVDRAHILTKKSWFEVPISSPQKLGEILCHKKVKWYGYDLKKIWHKLEVTNPIAIGDPMIAHHLITSKTSTSLSNLMYEKWHKEHLDQTDQAVLYISELRDDYVRRLEEEKLYTLYKEIELPLIKVLYNMEKRGIKVDSKILEKEKKELEVDLTGLEESIFSLAGHPFNISSPQQLGYVLFDELGLKTGRKTKTGYSTDSDVLASLVQAHPIAKPLLDYRELFKLKTTYVEGLLSSIDKKTKRVHTQFNQTLTATGRLSSTNPNLQNIPIRSERGRKIRDSFIASTKHVLIGADYAQMELAILAEMSGDKNLKKACTLGEDIHKATASEIFDTPIDQVTEEQRNRAKTVNFGVTYGQTAFSLSESLGVSYSEAKEIIDRYFTKFKHVKSYIEDILKQAERRGYVETLFGRRRWVPELQSNNMNMKKFGQRVVLNSPIQGTAGDLVKKAMIELDSCLWAQMLLQVHDELLFECPIEDQETELALIKKTMIQISPLSVPLKVHIGQGSSWNKASGK